MRAILTRQYGTTEVLEVGEIDPPDVEDEEILIKVHASSVNPLDWKIRRGDIRILTGSKPPLVLGHDYAGVISQIGKSVSDYKVGDGVFGMVKVFKGGTHAE